MQGSLNQFHDAIAILGFVVDDFFGFPVCAKSHHAGGFGFNTKARHFANDFGFARLLFLAVIFIRVLEFLGGSRKAQWLGNVKSLRTEEPSSRAGHFVDLENFVAVSIQSFEVLNNSVVSIAAPTLSFHFGHKKTQGNEGSKERKRGDAIHGKSKLGV